MRDFRNDRLGDPYVNPIDQGVRADDRMRAATAEGSRDMSRRPRLIVGWTIALAIIGFFVAALAGWIDVFAAV